MNIEEKEKLLDDIVKILVDYDDYVEDKHINLIVAARNMTRNTPLAFEEKPELELKEYWKYRTSPMINKIANHIVSYILTNKG